jgi:uncharacterized Zn finger protein
MTTALPNYHRAKCPACGSTCEQRRRPVLLPDGDRHAAYECRECETIYFIADADAPDQDEVQP